MISIGFELQSMRNARPFDSQEVNANAKTLSCRHCNKKILVSREKKCDIDCLMSGELCKIMNDKRINTLLCFRHCFWVMANDSETYLYVIVLPSAEMTGIGNIINTSIVPINANEPSAASVESSSFAPQRTQYIRVLQGVGKSLALFFEARLVTCGKQKPHVNEDGYLHFRSFYLLDWRSYRVGPPPRFYSTYTWKLAAIALIYISGTQC